MAEKLNGVGDIGPRGLGDIMPSSVDPMERYFRIIRGQVQLQRRGWIVSPQWLPPVVAGVEPFQKLLEEHAIPRQWQMLEDLFTLLQRGRFFVKSPNWMEPPITAEMEDLVSEDAVVVGATDTTIVTYTVPDRCICAFRAFGQMLTVSAEWGNVIWNIFVNEKPVRTYQEFKQQRGIVAAPTPFPKPITLKGRDIIKVTARTAGAAVSATARLMGYVIAAETVTQDGSYKDWNSR